MLLKRIYDEVDLERYKKARAEKFEEWRAKFTAIDTPDGLIAAFAKQVSETLTPLPLLAGLEVNHTGVSAEQHFSTPLITELVKLNIAQLDGDELIIRAAPEDLHYTIKRTPGRWCLHCGEKLSDDANGEMARLHIAMKHNGVASPDPETPAGYVWLTYFDCTLDAEQHARFAKVG